MIKRPCTRASFIIQTVMCDEASFNVTSVDDLRAKDSPLQACHASILVKSHPESKPQLVNLHCPLQLMRNKRRETKTQAQQKRNYKKTMEQANKHHDKASSYFVVCFEISNRCRARWQHCDVATARSWRSSRALPRQRWLRGKGAIIGDSNDERFSNECFGCLRLS